MAARLRQSFPSLSDTTLAQLVAAFEGQLPLHVQDIHVEGATAQLDTTTLGADGSATQIALTAGMAAPPPAGPPASEQGEHLSKSDLRVLKSVPPNSGGSKRAA